MITAGMLGPGDRIRYRADDGDIIDAEVEAIHPKNELIKLGNEKGWWWMPFKDIPDRVIEITTCSDPQGLNGETSTGWNSDTVVETIKTWKQDRPAISIKSIEDEAKIPSKTLWFALTGSRGLNDNHLKKLGPVLKKYGLNIVNVTSK